MSSILKTVALLLCPLAALSQSLEHYYPSTSGELVVHEYYTLDYNEEHEQANWVIYMCGETGNAKRSDNFRNDPMVETRSASLDDYKGSGYDRGHLVPAADMSMNSVAMSESFYMSNMSPQVPGFNRGIWKNLELLTRTWAANTKSETDVIITGPILSEVCGTIGNGVTVPCSYYKVYADPVKEIAIAFILPNKGADMELKEFACTIDKVEELTGIDFFHLLPDNKEEQLESLLDLNSWNWNPVLEDKPKPKSGDEAQLRCTGLTSSGNQCKRNAQPNSKFCWQHD